MKKIIVPEFSILDSIFREFKLLHKVVELKLNCCRLWVCSPHDVSW